MFVGIVGTLSAGKSTVASFLQEQGFQVLRLSDLLRAKAAARKLRDDRETLFCIANELREKFGPAALMDEALHHIGEREGDWVIDGIRTPAELQRLRARPSVHIIGVDASLKARYERALKRQASTGREENAATEDQFRHHELREDSEDPTRPQLRTVLAMADVILSNDRRAYGENLGGPRIISEAGSSISPGDHG